MSAKKEAETKPALRADAPAFVPLAKSPKTPTVENLQREPQCSRFSRKSNYRKEDNLKSPGSPRPILGSQVRVPRPILGRKENFLPKEKDDCMGEKLKPVCGRMSQMKIPSDDKIGEVCSKCKVQRSVSCFL